MGGGSLDRHPGSSTLPGQILSLAALVPRRPTRRIGGNMAPRWARTIAAGLGLLAAGWLGPALADVWPGSSWPTASPGVDPGKLADALAYGNRHGGAGMVV